ncbi:MAG: hypothetical protein IT450_19105 [Phycisphaerales bacterium]|nr:hypothetical protein [Phycisphaerales bacterium]
MMRTNLPRIGAVAATRLFWIAFTATLFGYLIALFAGEARVTIQLVPHNPSQLADIRKVEVDFRVNPASARVDLITWNRPAFLSAGLIPAENSSGYPLADSGWLGPIEHAKIGVHPLIALLVLGFVALWIVVCRFRRTSPRSPRIRRRLTQRITNASAFLMFVTIAGVGCSAVLGRIEIEGVIGNPVSALGAKTGDILSRCTGLGFDLKEVSASFSATKFKDWYGISLGTMESHSLFGLMNVTTASNANFDEGHVSVHPVLAIGIFAIVPIVAYFLRRKKRDDHPHCAACGYNLTGNVTGRCPECGSVSVPDRVG